jgi:hypothetical protein
MARKVIGPTGSRRRRWLFLCTSAAAIVMAVIFIPSALAVHDLQFQLDGDTTSTAFSPPSPNAGVAYDWNDIFNVTDNAPVPPATVGTETISNNSANVGSGKTFDDAQFTRDFETNATCPTTSGVGLDSRSTNFCTGDDTTYATGSKDTLGIGNGGWQCNHDNNVNSKIDITNAYVVQYTNPTPDANGVHHKIFYFGVERNVSNGTNDVGVWFLQGGASCSAPSGHLNFTGGHLDGDTLVVAEQTSGGGVSTAKAFRWAASTDPTSPFYGDGGCIDSNDNYNPAVVVNGTKGCNNLPIATGADCKTTGGGDSLCATTNANCPPPRRGTTVPPCTLPWNSAVTTNWLTANGSSVGNTVASPDFFEGGIDITAAFAGHGGTTPSCFSTVAPDTRSSASPTATLFDFTLNQLGGCGGSLTTQENAAASRQIGTDGTISSGTDSATLQITGTPSWGGTLSWYLCGPDVSTCDSNGVNVASEIVSSTDGATSAGTAKSYSTADSGITGNSTATLTAADASAGQYCWHAHFEPNTTSKAAGVKPQDDDGTNECFTVTPRTPTLTTSAHCYDSSNTQIDSACVIGSTLKDTASLTGTANNPNNDGSNLTYPSINGTTSPADSSITWTLYGPTSTGAAQCATAISSAPTPSSVTVSGDNASYGPVSYTTTASSGVGKYEFAASYDPTAGGTVASPNTTAPTSQVTCDTTGTNGEQVTVIGTATSSSKQGWLPNDRITINSTAGTKASGTITVTLYYGALATGKTLADCALATGAVQEFQDLNKTVTASTNSATFITDNTSFYVGVNPATGNATTPAGADTDATHSYFWLIHFVSDQGLTNPPDRCESATITHNDG